MSFYKTKKLISCCLVVCFLGMDIAWAAPEGKPRLSADKPGDGPEAPAFTIPAELGTIDEIQPPASKNAPFIIQIQTVHGHYETALKIKEILHYLKKNYGTNLLFAEGASEKLHPEFLKFLSDPEQNRKVIDALAQKGELTGVDLALTDPSFQVLGVEEPDLYREAYQAFKQVIRSLDESEAWLDKQRLVIDKEASRVFHKELRDLVSEWLKFNTAKPGSPAGGGDLMATLRFLRAAAQTSLELDFENPTVQFDWPQLTRLVLLQELETRLDEKVFKEDSERLEAWLRTNKIGFGFMEFLTDKNVGMASLPAERSATDQKTRKTTSQAVRFAHSDSPRLIAEKFLAETLPKGFKFSDYPQVTYRTAQKILQAELDAKPLLAEFDQLFESLIEKSTRVPPTSMESDTLRALIRQYKKHILLRKLMRLELASGEWRAMQADSEKLSVSRTEEGVPNRGIAWRFYTLMARREDAFLKSIQRALAAKSSRPSAILVAGGFHTEGMKQLFREKGMGYAVISPHISGEIDSTLYHKIMTRSANIEKPGALLRAQAELRMVGDKGYLRSELLSFERTVKSVTRGASIPDSAWFQNRHKVLSGRSEVRVKDKKPNIKAGSVAAGQGSLGLISRGGRDSLESSAPVVRSEVRGFGNLLAQVQMMSAGGEWGWMLAAGVSALAAVLLFGDGDSETRQLRGAPALVENPDAPPSNPISPVTKIMAITFAVDLGLLGLGAWNPWDLDLALYGWSTVGVSALGLGAALFVIATGRDIQKPPQRSEMRQAMSWGVEGSEKQAWSESFRQTVLILGEGTELARLVKSGKIQFEVKQNRPDDLSVQLIFDLGDGREEKTLLELMNYDTSTPRVVDSLGFESGLVLPEGFGEETRGGMPLGLYRSYLYKEIFWVLLVMLQKQGFERVDMAVRYEGGRKAFPALKEEWDKIWLSQYHNESPIEIRPHSTTHGLKGNFSLHFHIARANLTPVRPQFDHAVRTMTVTPGQRSEMRQDRGIERFLNPAGEVWTQPVKNPTELETRQSQISALTPDDLGPVFKLIENKYQEDPLSVEAAKAKKNAYVTFNFMRVFNEYMEAGHPVLNDLMTLSPGEEAFLLWNLLRLFFKGIPDQLFHNPLNTEAYISATSGERLRLFEEDSSLRQRLILSSNNGKYVNSPSNSRTLIETWLGKRLLAVARRDFDKERLGIGQHVYPPEPQKDSIVQTSNQLESDFPELWKKGVRNVRWWMKQPAEGGLSMNFYTADARQLLYKISAKDGLVYGVNPAGSFETPAEQEITSFQKNANDLVKQLIDFVKTQDRNTQRSWTKDPLLTSLLSKMVGNYDEKTGARITRRAGDGDQRSEVRHPSNAVGPINVKLLENENTGTFMAIDNTTVMAAIDEINRRRVELGIPADKRAKQVLAIEGVEAPLKTHSTETQIPRGRIFIVLFDDTQIEIRRFRRRSEMRQIPVKKLSGDPWDYQGMASIKILEESMVRIPAAPEGLVFDLTGLGEEETVSINFYLGQQGVHVPLTLSKQGVRIDQEAKGIQPSADPQRLQKGALFEGSSLMIGRADSLEQVEALNESEGLFLNRREILRSRLLRLKNYQEVEEIHLVIRRDPVRNLLQILDYSPFGVYLPLDTLDRVAGEEKKGGANAQSEVRSAAPGWSAEEIWYRDMMVSELKDLGASLSSGGWIVLYNTAGDGIQLEYAGQRLYKRERLAAQILDSANHLSQTRPILAPRTLVLGAKGVRIVDRDAMEGRSFEPVLAEDFLKEVRRPFPRFHEQLPAWFRPTNESRPLKSWNATFPVHSAYGIVTRDQDGYSELMHEALERFFEESFARKLGEDVRSEVRAIDNDFVSRKDYPKWLSKALEGAFAKLEAAQRELIPLAEELRKIQMGERSLFGAHEALNDSWKKIINEGFSKSDVSDLVTRTNDFAELWGVYVKEHAEKVRAEKEKLGMPTTVQQGAAIRIAAAKGDLFKVSKILVIIINEKINPALNGLVPYLKVLLLFAELRLDQPAAPFFKEQVDRLTKTAQRASTPAKRTSFKNVFLGKIRKQMNDSFKSQPLFQLIRNDFPLREEIEQLMLARIYVPLSLEFYSYEEDTGRFKELNQGIERSQVDAKKAQVEELLDVLSRAFLREEAVSKELRTNGAALLSRLLPFIQEHKTLEDKLQLYIHEWLRQDPELGKWDQLLMLFIKYTDNTNDIEMLKRWLGTTQDFSIKVELVAAYFQVLDHLRKADGWNFARISQALDELNQVLQQNKEEDSKKQEALIVFLGKAREYVLVHWRDIKEGRIMTVPREKGDAIQREASLLDALTWNRSRLFAAASVRGTERETEIEQDIRRLFDFYVAGQRQRAAGSKSEMRQPNDLAAKFGDKFQGGKTPGAAAGLRSEVRAKKAAEVAVPQNPLQKVFALSKGGNGVSFATLRNRSGLVGDEFDQVVAFLEAVGLAASDMEDRTPTRKLVLSEVASAQRLGVAAWLGEIDWPAAAEDLPRYQAEAERFENPISLNRGATQAVDKHFSEEFRLLQLAKDSLFDHLIDSFANGYFKGSTRLRLSEPNLLTGITAEIIFLIDFERDQLQMIRGKESWNFPLIRPPGIETPDPLKPSTWLRYSQLSVKAQDGLILPVLDFIHKKILFSETFAFTNRNKSYGKEDLKLWFDSVEHSGSLQEKRAGKVESQRNPERPFETEVQVLEKGDGTTQFWIRQFSQASWETWGNRAGLRWMTDKLDTRAPLKVSYFDLERWPEGAALLMAGEEEGHIDAGSEYLLRVFKPKRPQAVRDAQAEYEALFEKEGSLAYENTEIMEKYFHSRYLTLARSELRIVTLTEEQLLERVYEYLGFMFPLDEGLKEIYGRFLLRQRNLELSARGLARQARLTIKDAELSLRNAQTYFEELKDQPRRRVFEDQDLRDLVTAARQFEHSLNHEEDFAQNNGVIQELRWDVSTIAFLELNLDSTDSDADLIKMVRALPSHQEAGQIDYFDEPLRPKAEAFYAAYNKVRAGGRSEMRTRVQRKMIEAVEVLGAHIPAAKDWKDANAWQTSGFVLDKTVGSVGRAVWRHSASRHRLKASYALLPPMLRTLAEKQGQLPVAPIISVREEKEAVGLRSNRPTYLELYLEDFGYVNAKDYLASLSTDDQLQKLEFYLAYVQALETLNRAGILHGHPYFKNVQYHPETSDVRLIDFKLVKDPVSVGADFDLRLVRNVLSLELAAAKGKLVIPSDADYEKIKEILTQQVQRLQSTNDEKRSEVRLNQSEDHLWGEDKAPGDNFDDQWKMYWQKWLNYDANRTTAGPQILLTHWQIFWLQEWHFLKELVVFIIGGQLMLLGGMSGYEKLVSLSSSLGMLTFGLAISLGAVILARWRIEKTINILNKVRRRPEKDATFILGSLEDVLVIFDNLQKGGLRNDFRKATKLPVKTDKLSKNLFIFDASLMGKRTPGWLPLLYFKDVHQDNPEYLFNDEEVLKISLTGLSAGETLNDLWKIYQTRAQRKDQGIRWKFELRWRAEQKDFVLISIPSKLPPINLRSEMRQETKRPSLRDVRPVPVGNTKDLLEHVAVWIRAGYAIDEVTVTRNPLASAISWFLPNDLLNARTGPDFPVQFHQWLSRIVNDNASHFEGTHQMNLVQKGASIALEVKPISTEGSVRSEVRTPGKNLVTDFSGLREAVNSKVAEAAGIMEASRRQPWKLELQVGQPEDKKWYQGEFDHNGVEFFHRNPRDFGGFVQALVSGESNELALSERETVAMLNSRFLVELAPALNDEIELFIHVYPAGMDFTEMEILKVSPYLLRDITPPGKVSAEDSALDKLFVRRKFSKKHMTNKRTLQVVFGRTSLKEKFRLVWVAGPFFDDLVRGEGHVVDEDLWAKYQESLAARSSTEHQLSDLLEQFNTHLQEARDVFNGLNEKLINHVRAEDADAFKAFQEHFALLEMTPSDWPQIAAKDLFTDSEVENLRKKMERLGAFLNYALLPEAPEALSKLVQSKSSPYKQLGTEIEALFKIRAEILAAYQIFLTEKRSEVRTHAIGLDQQLKEPDLLLSGQTLDEKARNLKLELDQLGFWEHDYAISDLRYFQDGKTVTFNLKVDIHDFDWLGVIHWDSVIEISQDENNLKKITSLKTKAPFPSGSSASRQIFTGLIRLLYQRGFKEAELDIIRPRADEAMRSFLVSLGGEEGPGRAFEIDRLKQPEQRWVSHDAAEGDSYEMFYGTIKIRFDQLKDLLGSQIQGPSENLRSEVRSTRGGVTGLSFFQLPLITLRAGMSVSFKTALGFGLGTASPQWGLPLRSEFRRVLEQSAEDYSRQTQGASRNEPQNIAYFSILKERLGSAAEPVRVIRIYDKLPKLYDPEIQVLIDFLAKNKQAYLFLEIQNENAENLRLFERDLREAVQKRRRADKVTEGSDRGVNFKVNSDSSAYLRELKKLKHTRALIYGRDRSQLSELQAAMPEAVRNRMAFVQDDLELTADTLKRATVLLAELEQLFSSKNLRSEIMRASTLWTEQLELRREVQNLLSQSA